MRDNTFTLCILHKGVNLMHRLRDSRIVANLSGCLLEFYFFMVREGDRKFVSSIATENWNSSSHVNDGTILFSCY